MTRTDTLTRPGSGSCLALPLPPPSLPEPGISLAPLGEASSLSAPHSGTCGSESSNGSDPHPDPDPDPAPDSDSDSDSAPDPDPDPDPAPDLDRDPDS
eukprot:g26401.t1